jgi:hypothetical protein
MVVLLWIDRYIAERNKRSRYRPKHAGDGLLEGGKDLARGVFDGITGIVVKPVEGAIEGGVLLLLFVGCCFCLCLCFDTDCVCICV